MEQGRKHFRDINTHISKDKIATKFNVTEQILSEQDISDVSTAVNADSNEKMMLADYLVAFSGQSKSYCIGLVDMIGSTKIISKIAPKSWAKYYLIFLNSMAKILPDYGGIPFKNGGDSVLYYFPESSNDFSHSIMKSIDCSLKMVEMHDIICDITRKENLPCIDYRISMDYGNVLIMNQNNSSKIDMIGPPVNMCSKINHHADKDQVVIGGDLYQVAKKFSNFKFQQIEECAIGLKNGYPVYHVTRK
jgi:class 3 adenylate cyclase